MLTNTTRWETGWGNPPITKGFVQKLSALGFKTVRLPVAWDTYAVDGRIPTAKLERVNEVVDWIIEADMFCVVNIHWDGGWIDSSNKERFAGTYATFSPAAERKFRACARLRLMRNEFTAIFERDGDWFIAYCPEVTGANGQGRTQDEARVNLVEAIELILQDRREDVLRGLPEGALQEVVVVG